MMKNVASEWFWSENVWLHCVITQIQELEPILCHNGRRSQLIWTSSSNAHRSAFSVEDMQHKRGTQPYSSSKYATDLLSLALNTHYNDKVGSSKCQLVWTILSPLYHNLTFSGLVLVCDLSWFCDDQSDLWHPAFFPGVPLEAAHAHLLACE